MLSAVAPAKMPLVLQNVRNVLKVSAPVTSKYSIIIFF